MNERLSTHDAFVSVLEPGRYRMPRSTSLVFEVQADAVDTVPLVRWRFVTFSFEDMAQVSATSCTSNLDPGHPERLVFVASDSARKSIELQGCQ